MTIFRYNDRPSPRILIARRCSGVNILTGQKDTATPERRPTPIATSLRVGSESGTEDAKPISNDVASIASCLGLTQTTLRGMPRRDQRVVSLNHKILTMKDNTVERFKGSLPVFADCQHPMKSYFVERHDEPHRGPSVGPQ